MISSSSSQPKSKPNPNPTVICDPSPFVPTPQTVTLGEPGDEWFSLSDADIVLLLKYHHHSAPLLVFQAALPAKKQTRGRERANSADGKTKRSFGLAFGQRVGIPGLALRRGVGTLVTAWSPMSRLEERKPRRAPIRHFTASLLPHSRTYHTA